MLRYYRSAFYFVIAVIGYVLCSLTGTALQAPSTSYELPFGPNPFFPSQAKTDFRGFATVADFPPASYCSTCHQQIHKEWRESAHANSFRAPFYLKNVQLLIDQKGIAFGGPALDSVPLAHQKHQRYCSTYAAGRLIAMGSAFRPPKLSAMTQGLLRNWDCVKEASGPI